jgi:hypothetical protein
MTEREWKELRVAGRGSPSVPGVELPPPAVKNISIEGRNCLRWNSKDIGAAEIRY